MCFVGSGAVSLEPRVVNVVDDQSEKLRRRLRAAGQRRQRRAAARADEFRTGCVNDSGRARERAELL